MYELNLISGGEEIIYWGNDLRMKSKITGTSKYTKLLNLHNGRMAAAKDNGEIDIINLYNREIEFTLEGHTELIEGFDINQIYPLSPTEAVSCSKDKTIKLFDIQTGEAKLTVSHHTNEVKSILPVLLPLNAQFENISDIPKEYILQIGGHSNPIKSHLLHRIAPKFRFNIHLRAENIIQIEFMDADISFNQLFMPFVHSLLTHSWIIRQFRV